MGRLPRSESWRSRIVEAFEALGGDAPYTALYAQLGRMRERPLTSGEQAGVRREIENFSSDSRNYKPDRPDLFRSVGGLGSGHWGLRNRLALIVDQAEFREGERLFREVSQITRSRGLVTQARQIYGYDCRGCGFNFEAFYGEVGHAFIEVHHLEPVSKRTTRGVITIEDVTVLCANCHRMAHTSSPPLSIAELKKVISAAKR